jgi:GTPase SAR1 family protein
MAIKTEKVTTARDLMNQSQGELQDLSTERNVEDSSLALQRCIWDKQNELRKHKQGGEDRIKEFINSPSRSYDMLTTKGLGSSIQEDLDELIAVRAKYFPKKDYPLAWDSK